MKNYLYFTGLLDVLLCCSLHSRIIQVMVTFFLGDWCYTECVMVLIVHAIQMLHQTKCYICTHPSCLLVFDQYCFVPFADYHHWSQSCNRSHWGCKSRMQGCSCRIWRNHNQDDIRKGIYKVDMLSKPYFQIIEEFWYLLVQFLMTSTIFCQDQPQKICSQIGLCTFDGTQGVR